MKLTESILRKIIKEELDGNILGTENVPKDIMSVLDFKGDNGKINVNWSGTPPFIVRISGTSEYVEGYKVSTSNIDDAQKFNDLDDALVAATRIAMDGKNADIISI
jgi:hypothetical protein